QHPYAERGIINHSGNTTRTRTLTRNSIKEHSFTVRGLYGLRSRTPNRKCISISSHTSVPLNVDSCLINETRPSRGRTTNKVTSSATREPRIKIRPPAVPRINRITYRRARRGSRVSELTLPLKKSHCPPPAPGKLREKRRRE